MKQHIHMTEDFDPDCIACYMAEVERLRVELVEAKGWDRQHADEVERLQVLLRDATRRADSELAEVKRLRAELQDVVIAARTSKAMSEAEVERLREGQTNVGYWYRLADRRSREVAKLRAALERIAGSLDLETRSIARSALSDVRRARKTEEVR